MGVCNQLETDLDVRETKSSDDDDCRSGEHRLESIFGSKHDREKDRGHESYHYCLCDDVNDAHDSQKQPSSFDISLDVEGSFLNPNKGFLRNAHGCLKCSFRYSVWLNDGDD
jgi:hypothetical protein